MRGNRSAVSLIDGHIDEVNICICCHKVAVPVGKQFCKQCAEEIFEIIDDKEYNSIGTYTVPVGTTIKLSWKWNGSLHGLYVSNGQGSAEVRVDSNKKIKVTLAASKILIE